MFQIPHSEFRIASVAKLVVIAVATLMVARPATADVTAFLGSDFTPNSRLTLGAAGSIGFSILAFEGEYVSTSEDVTTGGPGLKTGMANALLQTPIAFKGVRPYVTAGVGVYHATLSTLNYSSTGFGTNIGGGVKIALISPLGLRLDYRVLMLGSGALFSPAHRFYAGLNIGF